jgi:hypothetical protein
MDTALSISSPGPGEVNIIRSSIESVEIAKSAISIELSEEPLATQLQLTVAPAAEASESHSESEGDFCSSDAMLVAGASPLRITLTSLLLRCGKQVKLVLGRDAADPSEPNPRLVEMIVKGRRWFDGLTTGRCTSLRAIATEEHCDKSHVSRLLTIAFLAPDILERILTGYHAATLTPERLRKTCPLPVHWEEQRALLIE